MATKTLFLVISGLSWLTVPATTPQIYFNIISVRPRSTLS